MSGEAGVPTKVILLFVIGAFLLLATSLSHYDAVQRYKRAHTPTVAPTIAPTAAPTALPTAAPTASPTTAPTASPTPTPTVAPGSPSVAPTAAPTPAPGASKRDGDSGSWASADFRSASFWYYYGLIGLAFGVVIAFLCVRCRAGGCILVGQKEGQKEEQRTVVNVFNQKLLSSSSRRRVSREYAAAPQDVYLDREYSRAPADLYAIQEAYRTEPVPTPDARANEDGEVSNSSVVVDARDAEEIERDEIAEMNRLMDAKMEAMTNMDISHHSVLSDESEKEEE